MRKDMSKIHTEPSRRPERKVANAGARYLARTPADELPSRETMRSRWNGYRHEQSRSYAPLNRFIASRVGRPWNSVYSEICRQNSLDNYAERKTREHLTNQVELNVHMVGDVPYSERGYPMLEGDFYVDPRDGILKVAPETPPRQYTPEPEKYPQVRIDDTHRYVRVNGSWFLVTFAALAPGNGALVAEDGADVILRLPQNAVRWSYVKVWWADVYACHKQQLGGSLLKRLRKQGVLPAA